MPLFSFYGEKKSPAIMALKYSLRGKPFLAIRTNNAYVLYRLSKKWSGETTRGKRYFV